MKAKTLKNEDILFLCLNTYIVLIFLSDTMSNWSSFKSVKHLFLMFIGQWLMFISSPGMKLSCCETLHQGATTTTS